MENDAFRRITVPKRISQYLHKLIIVLKKLDFSDAREQGICTVVYAFTKQKSGGTPTLVKVAIGKEEYAWLGSRIVLHTETVRPKRYDILTSLDLHTETKVTIDVLPVVVAEPERNHCEYVLGKSS